MVSNPLLVLDFCDPEVLYELYAGLSWADGVGLAPYTEDGGGCVHTDV